MSIPSEDFPAVKFSTLAAGAGLPPAIVLLVVIVSIVGMLLALLILWYFLSGRAREVAKMTQLQEEEGLEEFSVREVLREEDVLDHKFSVRTAGLLEVPRYRGNPPFSPSIFSTRFALEGVSSMEVTTAVLNVSEHTTSNTEDFCCDSDKCEVDICKEALELESIDLDTDSSHLASQVKGLMEEEAIGKEERHDFLSVQETSVYLSSTSLNIFQDDHQGDACLLVPSAGGAAGGSCCDVSFRSANNTFRAQSSSSSPVPSSFSSQLLASKNRSPPVFRIKFDEQVSSNMLPSRKGPLCDQDKCDKLLLDRSVELGTEY